MSGIGKGIGSIPKGVVKPPQAPRIPHMKMETPNYSQRTPIVNDNNFVDGNPPIATPTIGSPTATFNPGGKSGMPTSPRFIQPVGKRVYGTKGLTQKRQTSDL